MIFEEHATAQGTRQRQKAWYRMPIFYFSNPLRIFAIRVLAGGALTGTADRHSNASPPPAPMASSRTYNDDLERAQDFRFLLDDGYAASMAEASVRFVISNRDISTALVGIASIEQLEQALASAANGPLPTEVLDKLQRRLGVLCKQGMLVLEMSTSGAPYARRLASVPPRDSYLRKQAVWRRLSALSSRPLNRGDDPWPRHPRLDAIPRFPMSR